MNVYGQPSDQDLDFLNDHIYHSGSPGPGLKAVSKPS